MSVTECPATKHEYNASCLDRVEELRNQNNNPPPTTGVADLSESSGKAQKIGPYLAIYHESGRFSTIYRTTDTETKQLIAIKLTTPAQMEPPHNSRREARLLRAAAGDHVISLFSTRNVAGGHFLLIFPFMRYDLEAVLRPHVLSLAQIRSHLHDLFSALSHIHALGIIHRDIKPTNILLNSLDGPAYLADFGIAWSASDPDSEPANQKITDVGTTCYRPPELLFGNAAYNESLDLWSAGCVVAEALRPRAGVTLFDAGDMGSDLALIRSIFSTLGTPNNETWPVRRTIHKISFTPIVDTISGSKDVL